MPTIQVDEKTKRELFSVTAELQKLGKRVSLNEAISYLLQLHRGQKRNIGKLLALFGTVGPSWESRRLLTGLKMQEEKRLEQIARKHHT